MTDVTERARQALNGIETPTPWVAKWGGVYGTSGPKNTYRGTDGSPSVATAEGGFVEGEFLEGDADFIASAPDLVRDLVAEVERLRGSRDDVLAELVGLDGLLSERDARIARLRTDLARMTERAEGAEETP